MEVVPDGEGLEERELEETSSQLEDEPEARSGSELAPVDKRND